MKTGIYYGSATGTTAEVAKMIARKLSVADSDIHNVADTAVDTVGAYDMLVLGTSTWSSGELEDDWYDFLHGLEVVDLKGKRIALFGCGDETMTDTFCNGVGELYSRLQSTGATFVGQFPAGAYDFKDSSAVVDGMPVGLLLDQVNHPEMTPTRIVDWTSQLLQTK